MGNGTSKRVSRRFVLGGLLAGGASTALADAPLVSPRPQARVADYQRYAVSSAERLISQTGVSGKIGFVVADARTGLILETHNPVLGLPPASVTKTFSAQYALDALGPTHAFTTRLVGTGPVSAGVLQGDLILVGGGDPTLDTDRLASMAVALKAAGVNKVAGRFLVDGGALPDIWQIDPSQLEHLGYNPAISGLNLNYNRVHFEWKKTSSGYGVTMDARSANYRPEVAMARMRIVDRSLPVYTYADENGVDQWTVARSALGTGGSRWLPVRRPAIYTAQVFQIFARGQGIGLLRPELASGVERGTVLVEHKSPPLLKILKGMMKYSTNLTAEIMGLSATTAEVGTPADLRASASAMSDWAKARLGARKPIFVDHSGLGDATRVSASDMVTSLVRMGPDSTLASIMKPIAVRDKAGNVLGGSPVKIHAKTGTLNFVSALAGFVRTADGTDLAFAVFAADLDKRGAIQLGDRERPRGSRSWNGQARKVQQALIERWAMLYGT